MFDFARAAASVACIARLTLNGSKEMEYIGLVDTKGDLFVYRDSEALRNQIKKGIIEEKFIFTKKADESFEKPKKGFNIFKVRLS